ncbi:MAG: hypothetical protein KC635_06295 [Myxococcales bacterium]|nr:hypothetical protein [Myxococcales bacterium]
MPHCSAISVFGGSDNGSCSTFRVCTAEKSPSEYVCALPPSPRSCE